ncbi:MAG TPA: hypothetical protein PKY35_00345 [Candidatus Hydrogenedentes bacterium]|nr:hypothetical protein [Candidatus Hydrogenedentota bacterium]HOL75451.1 hypothetical protein [Candidatus Hydrogenedentota bacterium]HPO84960.1 hypothetical protein [Candidatus Hydrogenedentota bacterium]
MRGRCRLFAVWACFLILSYQVDALNVDTSSWKHVFPFSYDYVARETAGIERKYEPVELTLSVPGPTDKNWQNDIRVVRLSDDNMGELIPHQLLGKAESIYTPNETAVQPASAESANILFFASCPANGTVCYRLFWGSPKNKEKTATLPDAEDPNPLQVSGEPPALHIVNEFYDVTLDPKSGGILHTRLANRDESEKMFYHTIPMHFGVDVWSPPQGWDHDYDWPAPPNQRLEKGPLALRYFRWGPLSRYSDVMVSVTYTFYAHIPWVDISSTIHFTQNRSARAVRIGEIVVSHTHKPTPNEKDADGKSPDVLTHYAWPDEHRNIVSIDINAHRDEEGRANLQGVEPGALGILDWNVPWVAGWNAYRNYGIATLRKRDFVGNLSGNPTPKTVPCTYVANYGWGFTYWSRPAVYPFGARTTPEDQNTVVSAGTLFASEDALLFFEPDENLNQVITCYTRYTKPLRHEFRGTGPW